MKSQDKTFALHVGAHKTGTSVVQAYLREHEAALGAQGVYHFEREETNPYFNWGREVITNPAMLEGKLRSTFAHRRYSMMIASNENILGRPFVSKVRGRRTRQGRPIYPDAEPIIEALGKIMNSYDGRLIFSVRPQAAFVESYYLQTVHQGATTSFDEWLATLDLDGLSWNPIISMMCEAVGRERVIVLDFELIKKGQDRFLAEFFARIDPGLDIDPDFREARNRSVSEKGLKMALSVNQVVHDVEDRRGIRRFLQDHFSNVDYPRPTLLSAADRAAIDQRYAEEYRQLVSDFARPESAASPA